MSPLTRAGSYEEEVIIEEDDTIVSTPFNVEHQIHVDFASDTGFSVCILSYASLSAVCFGSCLLAKYTAVD